MNGPLATGAHISPIDPRDWTLASVGASTTYPPNRFIDMNWTKPSMQGQIGCCVGCTGEEVVRRIVYLTTGKTDELSWRFVYAVAKCLDGVAGEGTYPSLVAKIIRTYGVPLAIYCPNDVSLGHETFVYHRNLENIPHNAYVDALTRKSGADLTEPISEDGIKKAINYAADNKGGVMILREIGNTYWTDVNGVNTWDKAKLLPIRVPKTIESGHEEFVTGYDIDPNSGRTRIHWLNHWSEDWADDGFAWEYLDVWLPYIKEIRVSVAAIPTVDNFTYIFNKDLKLGDEGADVVALQHVLKIKGFFPLSQSFTGYFGTVTRSGVMAYQQAHNIPHTGFCGPLTRASLNA